MKKGKLKQNGVHLEQHEFATVHFLLEQGYDIELLPPMQIKNTRTADLVMDGAIWEMKSPQGSGKHTIKHNIQNANHQSMNIIFDLRRCGVPQERALKELRNHFLLSKRLRKMKVITKEEEALDFVK